VCAFLGLDSPRLLKEDGHGAQGKHGQTGGMQGTEVGEFPGKGSVLAHTAEETEEEGEDAAGAESLTRCPGTRARRPPPRALHATLAAAPTMGCGTWVM